MIGMPVALRECTLRSIQCVKCAQNQVVKPRQSLQLGRASAARTQDLSLPQCSSNSQMLHFQLRERVYSHLSYIGTDHPPNHSFQYPPIDSIHNHPLTISSHPISLQYLKLSLNSCCGWSLSTSRVQRKQRSYPGVGHIVQ
jgi:hypothetical protein